MDIDELIKNTAKNRFNIDKLRPIQLKIIKNILEKYNEKESNNLLVLLQTGGGKSICFLLPSVLVSGLTIIVYPLLALMKDQKRRLNDAQIPSAIIQGGQTKEYRNYIYKLLENKKVKVLIINPEVLLNDLVLNKLREFEITLFVIDEAHTICEWGLTFRPAYKELGEKINTLHIKQVLAFTATADKNTLEALSKYLFFNEQYQIIRGGVDRKNITYHIRYSFTKDREISIILKQKTMRPAIVFCQTRESTKISYHNFKLHEKNIECYYYHAGLSKKEKTKIEQEFFDSNTGVLFSTIAFGLGMDKNNIRCVIHRTIVNTNVLSFLQESGRGGRDGNISKSIVLFGADELKEHLRIKSSKTNKLNLIEIYQSGNCIRKGLCNYMGENIVKCSGCDVCSNSIFKSIDGLKSLISLIIFHPFLYTKKEIINILNGNSEYNICCCNYTLLSSWQHEDIQELIKSCLKIKLLIQLNNKIALNYKAYIKIYKFFKNH